MAREDRLARDAEKRQAGHGIGRDSRIPRVMQAHIRTDLELGDLLARTTTADVRFLNDTADPSKLKFVPFASVFGGPDVLP